MLEYVPRLKNPVFIFRVKHDLSQKTMAKILVIDVPTLQIFESDKRPLIKRTKKKVEWTVKVF